MPGPGLLGSLRLAWQPEGKRRVKTDRFVGLTSLCKLAILIFGGKRAFKKIPQVFSPQTLGKWPNKTNMRQEV